MRKIISIGHFSQRLKIPSYSKYVGTIRVFAVLVIQRSTKIK